MKKLFLILIFAIIHASDILDEPSIPEESFFWEQLSPSRVLDDIGFANSVLPSSQLNLHLPSAVSQATVSNRECVFCRKSFSIKKFLLRHLVSSHANDKGFLQYFVSHGGKPEKIHHCAQCPFVTLDKNHFAQHAARHSGVKLYYCEQCSRGFNLANDLRRHKFSIHHEDVADFKSYECSKCAASFTKNKLLINHMAKHDETTKSAGLTISSGIAKQNKKDVKSKHYFKSVPIQDTSLPSVNANFQITCAPIPQNALNLKKPDLPNNSTGIKLSAENKSAVEKKEICKICPDCGLKAKTKANLLVHIARHQNKPLYFCEVCQFGCYLKNDLSRHIISKHPDKATEAKSHACNKCPKFFARKDRLSKHYKLHQITFTDVSA